MRGTRRDDFVEHVCGLLVPLGEVQPRAMFGGYGIYVEGLFCAIAMADTLYFKADAGNRADYEALGAGPFRPFEGKELVMSYYEVPAQVLDDRRAIVEWGRKAMEAARRGTTSKRTSPRLASSRASRRGPR